MHFRSTKAKRNISPRPAIASVTAQNGDQGVGTNVARNKRPSMTEIASTIAIALVIRRCGSQSGTSRPHWSRFRLSTTGWPHSGHRSCGVKPQRLYLQPEQKHSCEMESFDVIDSKCAVIQRRMHGDCSSFKSPAGSGLSYGRAAVSGLRRYYTLRRRHRLCSLTKAT